jgi:hypothetical protein
MPPNDDLTVRAEPTKEFFIDMLVRDIDLIPAIIDLVDNSVDGARRVEPNGNYTNLWVRLELEGPRFRIADNCGGIEVDRARRYAFRFGRPEEEGQEKRSIGQFGVGMKRALFKLGEEFDIKSVTRTESWTMHISVAEWRKQDRWEFKFDSVDHRNVAASRTGTTIEIKPLHAAVAEEFGLGSFRARLAEEIRRAHQESMDRGLAISIDQIPLQVEPLLLLQSQELQPALETLNFNETGSPVTVRVFAGLGESDPRTAGWYVYCNGRLVVGPDQGLTTGWGTDVGTRIPRFHNQYSRFRGYAFFDSDDASRLPWTTTKTALDANSEIYRNVRQRMINLMRPVINFLNLLDREKDLAPSEEERAGELEAAVGRAQLVKLDAVEIKPKFQAPEVVIPKAERRSDLQSIEYSKPKDQISRVKRALGVRSARKAGEGTFDYFFERECKSDDG